MKLLSTMTALAPFLLKGPAKRPVRKIAGLLLSYALWAVGLLFLVIALFIWVNAEYGSVAATSAVGVIALGIALTLQLSIKTPIKPTPMLPSNLENDALAQKIPTEMKNDPVIKSILKQINDHPIPATAAALSLGMVIANEYFGD